MPIGAIFGAAGSVVGGLASASAAKKGAAAQMAASRESNALQREMWQQGRADLAPWRDSGGNALAAMQFELGLGDRPTFGGNPGLSITETPGTPGSAAIPQRGNPFGGGEQYVPGVASTPGTAASFNVGENAFGSRDAAQTYIDSQATGGTEYGGFKASPGYEFVRQQGEQGLERQLAARGQRMGGPAAKEAMRFNSGLASQEYGNFYNRLAGLSGTGQTATSTSINAGQNYANAAGANNQIGAQARASGYMGQANALNGTINNLFSISGANRAGYFGNSGGSNLFGGNSFGNTPWGNG
jgi:hypothetical protein